MLRFCLVLAGCCLIVINQGCSNFESSDGGNTLEAPPIDETAPIVDQVYPDGDSVLLEPDDVVEITFSEQVDLASLDAAIGLFEGSFEDGEEQLSPREIAYTTSTGFAYGTDPVTGEEIEIDTTIVTVTHATGRFALNTSYAVEIGFELKDLSPNETVHPITGLETTGNFIRDRLTIPFVTEDGAWRSETAVSMEADDGLVSSDQFFEPKVIANKNGDSFVVFARQRGGKRDLFISEFLADEKAFVLPGESAGSGSVNAQQLSVQDAELLPGEVAGSVQAYDISVSEQGQIAVVWTQPVEVAATAPASDASVWANVYNGNTWTGPQRLSNSSAAQHAKSPQVKIASTGHILAAWSQIEGGVRTVMASRNQFSISGGTWSLGSWSSTPDTVATDTTLPAVTPVLACLDAGVFSVAWIQAVTGGEQVATREYRAMEGWLPPVAVSATSSDVQQLSAAFDGTNRGFLTWLADGGLVDSLWLAAYSGGWQAPQLMENNDGGDVLNYSVAMSPLGSAALVWTQEEGTTRQVLARNYTADTAWSSEEALTSKTPSTYRNMRLEFDYEGNAMVVWQEGGAASRFSAQRYRKNAGWRESDGTVGASAASKFAPSLANLGYDGRLLLMWYELSGGAYRLVRNVFSDN